MPKLQIKRLVGLPFALLVASFASSVSAQSNSLGTPLADGADPYGPAVARMVRSIAEFTRWPDERRALRLCVAMPSDHADRIEEFSLSRQRRVTVRKGAFESFAPGSCDAIYFGRYSLEQLRTMVASLHGRPVLTIAENDPACRSKAMFCLLFGAESLNFRMNLDSVSRSGIRIDPRVLRLASPEGDVKWPKMPFGHRVSKP